jgi:predicted ATPase/DNA-binding CsgD family transcriptional regulator
VDSPRTAAGVLPSPPTRFIGRERTVAWLLQRLADDRLITVVGPGGSGKTRVAIEAGRRAEPSFPDGVFFVDLSGISDPGLVPSVVARAVGLRQPPEGTSAQVLVGQLAEREVLLVLDNCEHLVDACAHLGQALSGCPRVRVLATSRELLQVSGEAVVAIEGLELPGRARPGGEGWLQASEAGALFFDRARRARADFSLAESDALAIAEICERLDGIPLALELAAARTRMMSVQAIAKSLSDRFRLLVGTTRSGPPRHKTLLSCTEWSWDLLQDDERCLLRRLAVFASGFTIAAAEAICSGPGIERGQVLGLLTSLVDKSLVHAQAPLDRFRLHETMRDYSSSALEGAGEVALARDRHLDHFSALASAIGPSAWNDEMPNALGLFVADLDNFRAALEWSVGSKQFNAGAELMGAVAHFFYQLGLSSEASDRCGRLLAGELEGPKRSDLLSWACLFAWHRDPATSLNLTSALTALGHSLGDDRTVALGLIALARLQFLAQPAECIKTVDEAIPLALRTGQPILVAMGLCFRSQALMADGRPAEALAAAEETMWTSTDLGWQWNTTFARFATAQAALRVGNMSRALDEANIVCEAAVALSDRHLTLLAEKVRGTVFMYRGDPGAADALNRARAIAQSSFDRVNLAFVRICQGELQVRLGNLDEAYEILAEAASEVASLIGHRDPSSDALLAEVALWRGERSAARDYLGPGAGQRPAAVGPAALASLRAAARLARSEGNPRLSLAQACAALNVALQAGALLDVVDLTELVAMSSADLGRAVQAARLLGAAELQRKKIGYVRGVPADDELSPVRREVEATLGLAAFQRAFSEGRALTLAQAVAYARRGRGRRERREGPVVGWASLTQAERAVVLLVGQRLSNAEIAARLFVSTVTVKSHLSRVFTKLAVSNRRQLVAVVAEHEGEGLSPGG